MTQGSEAQVGSGGLANGPRTRATAIGPTLAAGPYQSAARSIVAPFDPVAYVYVGLGVRADEDERGLRSRRAVENLLRQGASEQAAAAIAAAACSEAPC